MPDIDVELKDEGRDQGGFTGPEADTLGYEIRKKKSSALRSMKETFGERAAERGVPARTIDAVFKDLVPFKRYLLNKAFGYRTNLEATVLIRAYAPESYNGVPRQLVSPGAVRIGQAIGGPSGAMRAERAPAAKSFGRLKAGQPLDRGCRHAYQFSR